MKKAIIVGIAAVSMASCSPKLAGTWNVASYEVTEAGKPGLSVSNIGTITFNKNNKGQKNIDYTVFQNQFTDKSPFQWFQDGEQVIRIDDQNSDLAKSWIVITNGRKTQEWRSTDGTNKVLVLKLNKL